VNFLGVAEKLGVEELIKGPGAVVRDYFSQNNTVNRNIDLKELAENLTAGQRKAIGDLLKNLITKDSEGNEADGVKDGHVDIDATHKLNLKRMDLTNLQGVDLLKRGMQKAVALGIRRLQQQTGLCDESHKDARKKEEEEEGGEGKGKRQLSQREEAQKIKDQHAKTLQLLNFTQALFRLPAVNAAIERNGNSGTKSKDSKNSPKAVSSLASGSRERWISPVQVGRDVVKKLKEAAEAYLG
jgi:hypothetical protein